MRSLVLIAVLLTAHGSAVVQGHAAAQGADSYPSKPVRMVVAAAVKPAGIKVE